jgi:excisionase family DNA binding protein
MIAMDIEGFVTSAKAAELLGMTQGRVRQLLRSGTLKGRRMGARAWLVEKISVAAYASRTKTCGRPTSAEPKI